MRRGFTLIELLVVIAIIAILAAILFPVFARAREKARQTSCLSNVKQLALGCHMYAQDYDETLPCVQHRSPTTFYGYWYQVIQPYVNNMQIVVCPSSKRTTPGYGWNYPHAGYRLDRNNQVFLGDIRYPAEMMIFGDSDPTGSSSTWYRLFLYCAAAGGGTTHWVFPPGIRNETNIIATRHQDGANFAFADGHAKWRSVSGLSGTSADVQRFWGHPTPRTSP